MNRSILSEQYRSALRWTVGWVGFFAILSGLMLDFGRLAQICAFAMAAYFVLVLLVLARRPWTPTHADLLAIKWGLPFLVFVALVLCPFVWHLRGAL